MTEAATATRTVIIERDLPYPAEKLWRALTQRHLIAEWLMNNDFKLEQGHRFTFTADWGSVDCQVLAIELNKKLSYQWDAMGLESVVTFTLTSAGTGTQLRIEQSGFRPDQERAFQGAKYGWQNFLGKLDELLAKLD